MTRLSTLPSHREQAHHALVLLGVPAPARLVVEVHSALFDGDLSVPALAALLRDEQRRCRPAQPGAAAFRWGPSNSERDPDAATPRWGRAEGDPDTAAFRWAPASAEDASDPALQRSHAGAESDADSAAFRWAPAGDPAAGPDAPAAAVPTAEAGGQGGTVRRPYLVCPGLNLDLTAARGHLTLSTWATADRICAPAAAKAAALVATVRIAEFVAMRPGRSATRLLRQLAASVPGGPEAGDHPRAVAEAAREALADPALAGAVAAEAPLREAAARRAARLDEPQRLFGVTGLPQQRGGA